MGVIIELATWKRQKEVKQRLVRECKRHRYNQIKMKRLLREFGILDEPTIQVAPKKELPIGKARVSNITSRECDRRLIAFKLSFKRHYKNDAVLCNDAALSDVFFKFALRGKARYDSVNTYKFLNDTHEYDKDYNKIPKKTFANAHANDNDLLNKLNAMLDGDTLDIDYNRYESEKAERAKWDPLYDIFESRNEDRERRIKLIEDEEKSIKNLDELRVKQKAEYEAWKADYDNRNKEWEQKAMDEYLKYIGKNKP